MKRILALLLVLMLALALTACGGGKDAGGAAAPADSSDSGAAATGTGEGDGKGVNTPNKEGSMSRKDMEKYVSQMISGIGGPEQVTLCGGDIEYTPGSEWGFVGDMWEIENPDMEYTALKDSLAAQLTGAGFAETYNLFGQVWYVHAGVEQIGLTLFDYYEGDETYTVLMTHASKDYSTSYIAEMEAAMPAIIPGADARDAMGDQCQISWQSSYGLIETVACKDGAWFASADWSQTDDGGSEYCSAAIPRDGGGYDCYEWTGRDSDHGQPRSDDRFTSHPDVEDLLRSYFDADGFNDYPGISSWLQMCKDYTEGETYKTMARYAITSSMVVTGTETIAGVECQIITNDTMFSCSEYAVDPVTGLLFRYGEEDYDGNMQYLHTVTYYSDSTNLLDGFN